MIPSIGEKRFPLPVFTIEECKSCGLKTKRSFEKGDYVYRTKNECKNCKAPVMITKIYCESVKPK